MARVAVRFDQASGDTGFEDSVETPLTLGDWLERRLAAATPTIRLSEPQADTQPVSPSEVGQSWFEDEVLFGTQAEPSTPETARFDDFDLAFEPVGAPTVPDPAPLELLADPEPAVEAAVVTLPDLSSAAAAEQPALDQTTDDLDLDDVFLALGALRERASAIRPTEPAAIIEEPGPPEAEAALAPERPAPMLEAPTPTVEAASVALDLEERLAERIAALLDVRFEALAAELASARLHATERDREADQRLQARWTELAETLSGLGGAIESLETSTGRTVRRLARELLKLATAFDRRLRALDGRLADLARPAPVAPAAAALGAPELAKSQTGEDWEAELFAAPPSAQPGPASPSAAQPKPAAPRFRLKLPLFGGKTPGRTLRNAVAASGAVAVASADPTASLAAVRSAERTAALQAPAPAQLASTPAALRPAPKLDPVATLTQAAERGDRTSQVTLAALYEEGSDTVRPDASLARRWTAAAAEDGEPQAMHNLGLYFYEGLGGPKSAAAAAFWFAQAARLGVEESRFNLERLIATGVRPPSLEA